MKAHLKINKLWLRLSRTQASKVESINRLAFDCLLRADNKCQSSLPTTLAVRQITAFDRAVSCETATTRRRRSREMRNRERRESQNCLLW